MPVSAFGQTTSGVITGQVEDSSGAAIAQAKVTLIDQQTSVTQSVVTNKDGYFVFPAVKPATYTISAESEGFKTFEKKGVIVLAADHIGLGVMKLPIGAVSATVSVSADVTPVQTTSSERSAQITSEQMQGLLSIGRDFTSLLRILPGSTYEGTGNNQLNTASVGNFNGVSNNYNSINTDGVASNTRNVGITEGPLNMDAIQEIKVLNSNYQAEYGKVAGTIVDVVSKSGTKQFHGSLAYYLRNEAMNANSYFNNRSGVARQRYRYNTITGTIGGPLYGPGIFQSLKDKLFFFYSQDYEPSTTPLAISNYTVPTALERQGDFSQSVNSSGQLYVVLDPTTGQPFAGNKIPASRINADMQKLLNIFPAPNFTNRAISNGNYNYVIGGSSNSPAYQEELRLDYNPSDKLHTYFRGQDLTDNSTSRSRPAINAAWMPETVFYNTSGPSFAFNATYTPTNNIVNELAMGAGLWFETSGASQAALDRFSKSKQGINLGQLYPQNNPLGLVPGMSFGGGIPNAAGVAYDSRFPMDDFVLTPSVSDGLSYVHGYHNMKVGVYWDNAIYKQAHHSGNAPFTGTFTFSGANQVNPFNTGYAYAEALLGYFDQYQESSNRVNYYPVSTTFEWYAQDNWRATRKLTLEYGLRFTVDVTQKLKNNQGASLFFDQYKASDAPPLFQPIMVNGARMMKNPVTGQIYPAVYYNQFVPGVGNPAPGSIAASSANFPGIFQSQGMLVAPRLGFAYDLFGNGKTAIRGGFGIFNNQRIWQGQLGNAAFNPPTISYPTSYYGNVSTYLTAQGVQSPQSTTVFQRNSHLPQNMNMTLGIQQSLGFQTVLDVAYVGVLGRHQMYSVNLNTVPYGAQFLPQNQDPTTGKVLTDNYFRPYPGYNNITGTFWGDNSNYHSLQLQINRRFNNGLQFGGAYTWSKALDGNLGYLYLPSRISYGPSGNDRRNRLVINGLWDLPKASRFWNNWGSRTILDGWQLTGIATFSTGSPQRIGGFSTSNGQNTTGGGDGATITINGNAQLARGDRTFNRAFNTSVYSLTPVGSVGNGWTTQFFGPGINNIDTALIKNVKMERFNFQLRGEAYNVLNHTQFSGVNTSANFNASGVQTNTAFGQYNSARASRTMQVSARISF